MGNLEASSKAQVKLVLSAEAARLTHFPSSLPHSPVQPMAHAHSLSWPPRGLDWSHSHHMSYIPLSFG